MSFYHFQEFPSLSTQRLSLRKLTTEDSTSLFRLKSNPALVKYLNKHTCPSEEEAMQFIKKIDQGISEHKWIYWAIIHKELKQLIGTICFWFYNEKEASIEVGFEMDPFHQNKGYASEALKHVIEFAKKQTRLQSIKGITHEENIASISLMKNAGFQFIRKLTVEEKFEEEKSQPLLLFTYSL